MSETSNSHSIFTSLFPDYVGIYLQKDRGTLGSDPSARRRPGKRRECDTSAFFTSSPDSKAINPIKTTDYSSRQPDALWEFGIPDCSQSIAAFINHLRCLVALRLV